MSPTEEKLHDALERLRTRDDFVRFVELMVISIKEPGPLWENADVESFLTALAQAARQLETYYDSASEGAARVAAPNWESVAGMLFSARCDRGQK
jgi:hypothetical protein